MLQIYVLMTTRGVFSKGPVISILISTLTTGYASTMIAYDMDIGGRKADPIFYGYLPDDHGLRNRCFVLVVLMSALHNFSRSVGCALLAASGGATIVLLFVGGEMLFYLSWKVIKGDFMYWIPIDGPLGVICSFINRVVVKVIVDFSGCLQFRHPQEIGGTAFSLSMIWAQAMPFVALLLYKTKVDDGEAVEMNEHFNITNSTSQLPYENDNDEADIGGELEKSKIAIVLACSFILWLLTNLAFFCTIDLSYMHTFWLLKTGPQYTCERFQGSSQDSERFKVVFHKRMSYTKSIHGEIKEWVAANIDQWREERPEWFDIERIPDEFLPPRVVLAEGGATGRRRSSIGLKELVGGNSVVNSED